MTKVEALRQKIAALEAEQPTAERRPKLEAELERQRWLLAKEIEYEGDSE